MSVRWSTTTPSKLTVRLLIFGSLPTAEDCGLAFDDASGNSALPAEESEAAGNREAIRFDGGE